jgi:hypothetical protein
MTKHDEPEKVDLRAMDVAEEKRRERPVEHNLDALL